LEEGGRLERHSKWKTKSTRYEEKRMLSRETVRDGPYYWRDQTAVGVLTARKLERRNGEEEERERGRES